MDINPLHFRPLPGMASCHLQTIVSSLFPAGRRPPSTEWRIDLGGGDLLSCAVSTPPTWNKSHPTVVMVHGMGGSHASGYMIRLARKLYRKGTKVVRVNLRGCGSGKGLSKLLYNAGTSGDVLNVLHGITNEAPASEITLCGFSLGGNLILKLAGELGTEAKELVKTFIAVCAPLDLAQAVRTIQEKRNRFYHSYYLKHIHRQARPGIPQTIFTLYEFDDAITAPPWGYKGAAHYYEECSSIRFLPQIAQSTHLLFAKDDPFIGMEALHRITVPSSIKVWTTEKGGHMGFLGRGPKAGGFFWMDDLLLQWIDEDFTTHRASSP